MRQIPRRLLSFVPLLVAFAGAPVMAHHGWSTYDETRPLTVTGKVVESRYENPHASIRVEADGKRWLAILAPISRMEARGASAEKVAVGRQVTLVTVRFLALALVVLPPYLRVRCGSLNNRAIGGWSHSKIDAPILQTRCCLDPARRSRGL